MSDAIVEAVGCCLVEWLGRRCRNVRRYSSWVVCRGKKYDFNLNVAVLGSKLVLKLNKGGELPLDYLGLVETFEIELGDHGMLDEVKKIVYRFARRHR